VSEWGLTPHPTQHVISKTDTVRKQNTAATSQTELIIRTHQHLHIQNNDKKLQTNALHSD